MARIHDLFIVELAEVIKGYGNDPDVEDQFSLSEFEESLRKAVEQCKV